MVSVSVVDDRIAIAELAAVIHFDRNARQLLDHELAGQAGVPAGAAGDDLDVAAMPGSLFALMSISSRKTLPVS